MNGSAATAMRVTRSMRMHCGGRAPRWTATSAVQRLPEERRDRIVLLRHVDNAEAEAIAELRAIDLAAVRAKEHDVRAGHYGGPHELVGACFLMIAIDEDEARADAQERGADPLIVAYEVRHVSREFDGGAEQGRSKGIR